MKSLGGNIMSGGMLKKAPINILLGGENRVKFPKSFLLKLFTLFEGNVENFPYDKTRYRLKLLF
jgi:hypothetical protein